MLSHIFRLLLVAGLLTGTSWAANDPFVGQWKLNPSRSKLTDEMKVTKVGHNKYSFDLGGGSPETVVVNGTDQPGNAGSTLSVAAEGPNWKVIRKTGGRMSITATWTLSKDGNSLTDDFTSFDQDGSPSSVKYVYRRTAAGSSGFAGTWVSTSEVVNSVFTLQISPYESDGLSFAGAGGTTNVKFDGKSARRLSASALERIQRYKGKITQTKQYKLSSDLNTLTITARTVGHTAPNIFVFERQ
ncbi:MAG: hypothetical protein WAK94_05360 [Steroidobacteraceae bacterium]